VTARTGRSRDRIGTGVAGLVASALLVAACSGAGPQATGRGSRAMVHVAHTGPGTKGATTTTTTTSTTTLPPTTTTTVPPTTTTTTEQPGWAVVSTGPLGVLVDRTTVTGPYGGAVTIVRMRAGRVRFDLHVGSQDPPVTAPVPPDRGPTVAADEAPLLVGAFNGGFKMDAGAGGFEVQGSVLRPVVPGLASFVIDADGTGHVGVWGQTVPGPGEQVASVRQNLPALVIGGRPSPTVGILGDWGATLGGGAAVARSAVGEDAQGDIVYAAGMSLVPADLAAALVDAGVVTAMELDINPEWVQCDAAPLPGGPLSAMVPAQNRPADQYQAGWTRDFFTVLAAG
jgi:hypothetical protein